MVVSKRPDIRNTGSLYRPDVGSILPSAAARSVNATSFGTEMRADVVEQVGISNAFP